MLIVRLLKQTSLQWHQSRAFELGAALAFYAIFSIAPVIVLAFTPPAWFSAGGGAGPGGPGDRKQRRVYYSSQVVLFGAEFTRVYAKHRSSPLEPKENAVSRQPESGMHDAKRGANIAIGLISPLPAMYNETPNWSSTALNAAPPEIDSKLSDD